MKKITDRLVGLSVTYKEVYTNSDMNSHILITGMSGSGKTHLIYNMIYQDYINKIPIVIIDAANSFSFSEISEEFKMAVSDNINIINVDRDIIPINPFLPKEYNDNCEKWFESPKQVAGRIASILNESLHYGVNQYALLHETIIEMLEEYKLGSDAELSFSALKARLETGIFSKEKRDIAKRTAYKLSILNSKVEFSSQSDNIWKEMFKTSNRKILIFQLSSLDKNTIKLVTDIILEDLFSYIKMNGNVNKPMTLILDELQNINNKEDSILGKLLTESRKYGLSMVCSTQFLKFTDNSQIIRKLEQAATRIVFSPTEDEVSGLVKEFSMGSGFDWNIVFRTMHKGECVIKCIADRTDETDMLVYVYPFDILLKKIKNMRRQLNFNF